MSEGKRIALMWLIVALTYAIGILLCLGQPVPKVPIATNAVSDDMYPWLYFAATATDSIGLESDYSNEAIFVWYQHTQDATITLAWEPSPSSNIVNYRVYWGSESRTYTNNVSAGIALTCSVTAKAKKWKQIVTIWATNAPWLSITNPANTVFVRSRSWQDFYGNWATVLQVANYLQGPWYDFGYTVTNVLKPNVRLHMERAFE